MFFLNAPAMNLLVAYILLAIFRQGSSASPPASGFRDSSPLPISLKTLAFSWILWSRKAPGVDQIGSMYIYIHT